MIAPQKRFRNYQKLNDKKKECIRLILDMHYHAKAGHIASSLSCLDILIYLFFGKMKPCDKFILSKGHAASALYAVLYLLGKIDRRLLNTFHRDGTSLAAHPPCNSFLRDIPFGTGSLGHGLSLAAGIALASNFLRKKFQVYCLLSDGDCDEGSTWEAALFAAHHKLSNLTVVIDNNNLQGFGYSCDVLNIEPLKEKWLAFNFNVSVAGNGNNFHDIHEAFQKLSHKKTNKPKCLIAKTVKGSGISFMENKMEWHYLPMDEKQYRDAVKQVEKL